MERYEDFSNEEFEKQFELEKQMFETSRNFKLLTRILLRQTGHFSMSNQQRAHPAYGKILNMGMRAVPHVVKKIHSGHSGVIQCLLHDLTQEAPFFPEEFHGRMYLVHHIWLDWALRGPGLRFVYSGLAEELDGWDGDFFTKIFYHPSFAHMVRIGMRMIDYLLADLKVWRETGIGPDPYWRAEAISSINGKYMPGIPRIEEGEPAAIDWIIEWGRRQHYPKYSDSFQSV